MVGKQLGIPITYRVVDEYQLYGRFEEFGPNPLRRINPEVVTHAVDLPDPRAWLNAFRETPA